MGTLTESSYFSVPVLYTHSHISVLMAACVYQASAVFILMSGSKTRAAYHIITVRRSTTPPGYTGTHIHTQFRGCSGFVCLMSVFYDLMCWFSVLNEPCTALYGLNPFFVCVYLCYCVFVHILYAYLCIPIIVCLLVFICAFVTCVCRSDPHQHTRFSIWKKKDCLQIGNRAGGSPF